MPAEPSLPSLAPDIRLHGPISQATLSEFLRQQAEVPSGKPLVLELSTEGGDADVARRIAGELRLLQGPGGREVWFLGKSYVFSAGITLMAAIPRARRVLTSDTELLIHERRLDKKLNLKGPLSVCSDLLRIATDEVESGLRLEREGFKELVEGSFVGVEDILIRTQGTDWYLPAPAALKLGLVASVI